MGRRDKSYSRDLKQQMNDRLTSMLRAGVGTSKREAMKDETYHDKIFSYNTYKTYFKHCRYFADYVKKNHPECTTLGKARNYVNEWLKYRTEHGGKDGKPLSAWTLQTEAKSLSKLYGIRPDSPDYFTPPKRERENIVRSRVDVERDKHFSAANNDELIKFCKGTGLRRSELQNLTGASLISREELEGEWVFAHTATGRDGIVRDAVERFDADYYLQIKGKGGRERISPVIGKDAERIVERIKNTGANEKVWQYVPSNADIHSYRADYATSIYKSKARDIKDIPYDKMNKGTGKMYQSEVYVCRKDESGKKLDRSAMEDASKALGHNRIEVVANNYIRGL